MKITRPEVQKSLVNQGGITDLMDNMVKLFYNITDEELDHICENATDNELKFFTEVSAKEERLSFSEIRNAFEIRNKYVAYYQ